MVGSPSTSTASSMSRARDLADERRSWPSSSTTTVPSPPVRRDEAPARAAPSPPRRAPIVTGRRSSLGGRRSAVRAQGGAGDGRPADPGRHPVRLPGHGRSPRRARRRRLRLHLPPPHEAREPLPGVPSSTASSSKNSRPNAASSGCSSLRPHEPPPQHGIVPPRPGLTGGERGITRRSSPRPVVFPRAPGRGWRSTRASVSAAGRAVGRAGEVGRVPDVNRSPRHGIHRWLCAKRSASGEVGAKVGAYLGRGPNTVLIDPLLDDEVPGARRHRPGEVGRDHHPYHVRSCVRGAGAMGRRGRPPRPRQAPARSKPVTGPDLQRLACTSHAGRSARSSAPARALAFGRSSRRRRAALLETTRSPQRATVRKTARPLQHLMDVDFDTRSSARRSRMNRQAAPGRTQRRHLVQRGHER